MKKRIICLLMVLAILLSTLPMTVLAAADAKPNKITLVGSEIALSYEKTGTLDYWGTDVPLYEVSVPAGTTSVRLYDSSVYISSYGSGYAAANGLASATDWTTATVGSSSPYTIETRMNGELQNLSFVKHASYVGSNADGYILKFVEQLDPSAAPEITTNLSTAQVNYTYGDTAAALSVDATGDGTVTYQWQVSTTSATAGFEEIDKATSKTYTPSTSRTGDYWYRVVVTNQKTGMGKTSVTSAVTPVRVSAPAGQTFVYLRTPIGAKSSRAMSFTLKNAAGQTVELTKDTSTGYAVYEFFAKPGTYTYSAVDTLDGVAHVLGEGTLEFKDVGQNEFRFALAYVYVNNKDLAPTDYTTEVKAADGTIMTPGEAYTFNSYSNPGYPYFIPEGSYTYQLKPKASFVAEGWQSNTPTSKTLTASKNSASEWYMTLKQVATTTFTVAKGASVELTIAGKAKAYAKGTVVTPTSVDKNAADKDVYTYSLEGGSKYIYRIGGVGRTKAECFTAGTANKAFDLTAQKNKSASEIVRTVTAGGTQNADLRITGVDYTGLVELSTLGSTKQLTPHRMWQIGSQSSVTSSSNDILEPDFHYTVVDEHGQPSDVVTVSANGLITAKKNGIAYVLVTYDAIDVGAWQWSACQNQTYSAIWPENTGVVVVASGSAASSIDQTAGNFLINETGTYNTTTYKTAGKHLDAELDPLYYATGSGYTYTYRSTFDSTTVEVLKPVLSQTGLSFAGYETVTENTDGSFTLILPEGKNIVRITDDDSEEVTYQVISVKKATYVIDNADDPGQPIAPGQTAKVTLNVNTPVNFTAKLNNTTTQITYTSGTGTTLTSTALSGGYGAAAERYEFDGTNGEAGRTITIKIPQQVGDELRLTGGTFRMTGNFAKLGTHHSTDSSSSVPYRNSNPVLLGSLPDIVIPISGASRATEPELKGGVYRIGTANELKWFATQVNSGAGKTYKAVLTADIDLADYAWLPIGTSSNPFSGSFDGQGHKISNLNINLTGTSYVGLFGYVTGTSASSPAVIRNVTVASGSVKASGKAVSYVGGIVGGVNSSNVTIENCVNYADVTVKTDTLYACVGGVVGTFGSSTWGDGLTISGCGNYGTIHASVFTNGYMAGYCYASAVSGVVGQGVGTMSITSCYNCGDITSGGQAGGVIGRYSGRSNSTTVLKDLYNTGAISGGEYVGGIAGLVSNGVAITNAYSTTIPVARDEYSGKTNAVGGIVGTRSGALTNVYYFDGNLSASGDKAKEGDTAYPRNEAALKALTVAELGGAFLPDSKNINNGYPILAVQTEIKDFKITALPAKTTYARLSSVDLTGIQATAIVDGALTQLDASMLTATPKTFTTVGTQIVTVSFAGHTATFNATVRELTAEDISLSTTLVDGASRKGSRMVFDVVARINGNTKVNVSDVVVKLDGSPVSHTWDDANKTSYTVNFTESGDHTITISVLDVMTETYTIHYTKVEPGEKIGEIVFSLEAFTIGGGYIIEPQVVEIREGENGAQMLDRVLRENDIAYTNTGSLESGFYLSNIRSDILADIDLTGNSVPQVLRDRLTIRPREIPNRLSEFDYAGGSGWMISVNNIFPNVGFSNIYPDDGDVLRLQFTLAYGMDLGGGYSTGGATTDWFPTANKGALTTLIAQRNCVVSDEILAVVTKVNAVQSEADAAVAILKKAAAVEALIDEIGTVTDDDACRQRINNAQARYDALSEVEQKNVRNASALQEANAAVAANVDALISAIGSVTADSGKAIRAARAAYDALTDLQKSLCKYYDQLDVCERLYTRALSGKNSVPAKNENAEPEQDAPEMELFEDVSRDDWFYDSVSYVIRHGLMKGVSKTEFAPNSTITRAMLVTILYRLEGEPAVTGSHSFRDAAQSGWYADAITWACENGIVTGYNASSFGPDDSITREQLASILYRYAKYKSYDTQASASLLGFSDVGAVSVWSAESVQWAVAQKLISGRSATQLAPTGTATRAEAAAILERFCTTVE